MNTRSATAPCPVTAQPETSADMALLDDAAFERFLQQIVADAAAQRRAAWVWRLPTLVAAETVA
jgi:hypothetical protein